MKVVDALLKADGIDVNQVNVTSGSFPLQVATQEGHAEVVKVLLQVDSINVNQVNEKGGRVPWSMLAYLLAHQITPLLADVTMETKAGDGLALNTAAEEGHTAVVRELLQADGIDVNQVCERNGTFPLYLAALRGHIAAVEELLAVDGIDINQENKKLGGSALYVAARFGHAEVGESASPSRQD